jgi:RNA polymerase sigma-70 factor, ECF subfamily
LPVVRNVVTWQSVEYHDARLSADYRLLLVKGPRVITGMGESAASPGSTASNLLGQVKANEGPAWQRLAVLYAPLVYSWARRAGLQAEDAADVVQEVFRAVLMHIADYESGPGPGSFRAWLWTITRNKVRDHWRRQQRQPVGVGGSDAQERLLESPAPECPQDEEPAGAGGGVLQRALERIRPQFEERTWQAFWRVTAEDQCPAEVAAALGMSVNAVYVARSRVLARLRQELGEAP